MRQAHEESIIGSDRELKREFVTLGGGVHSAEEIQHKPGVVCGGAALDHRVADILGGTKGSVSNEDKKEGLVGAEGVDEGMFVADPSEEI